MRPRRSDVGRIVKGLRLLFVIFGVSMLFIPRFLEVGGWARWIEASGGFGWIMRRRGVVRTPKTAEVKGLHRLLILLVQNGRLRSRIISTTIL